MKDRIKYLLSGIFVLLFVASGMVLKAQNATDLRFNEVLVHNESNYVDSYGVRSSWIEIVNTSYNYIDIGGCFLTNNLENPTKYWIPSGTPQTLIPPRGYIVFYAYDNPTRGVFHLNFDLTDSKIIALFDTNGRTLIDKLEITTGHEADVAYARVNPDSDKWIFQKQTTPGSDNNFSRKVTAGEEFVVMDPTGLGMTLIAMFVVFLALIVLYFIFKGTGRYFTRQKAEKVKPGETAGIAPPVHTTLTGEVNAAIAMSLYLYQNETHDFENTVLTIKKVSRTYSPWSSKIYTLRRPPRHIG